MKILIAFNNYADIPTGGERNVVFAEEQLLRKHGHEVYLWERSNAEIHSMSWKQKLAAFSNLTWSEQSKREAAKILNEFKPDIFHLHNYWLLMTPSVFAAARELNIPTVYTLHNFRMICPGAQLMYKGRPCEDCLRDGKFARCLLRGCFPGGSRFKTFLSLRLFYATRQRQFLKNEVNAFIALSKFSKEKFIQGGLDAKKIFVKPNFLEDPLLSTPPEPGKPGALFIGRLSAEKGISELLDVWEKINYPLTVVGEGVLKERLQARKVPGVTFTGGLTRDEVLRLLAQSTFLIFPSVWYETFGLTMIEAMAMGKPVLATNLGGRGEIVEEGITGFLYNPFEPGETEAAIRKMLALSPSEKERMGVAAREKYLKYYTPETNYQILIDIYQKASRNLPEA
jgi:glycosyltransferase involved in cell wall biosynthesis